MLELDENAWGHMHQAAYRGFLKSLKRFVEEDSSALESETNDDLRATPFLLAVASGNLETVECLLELGAKIEAINNQNHGAVEICALKGYTELLVYFLNKEDEKLPVWKKLIQFLGSDLEEEAEACGKSLQQLTDPSGSHYKKHREQLYNNGVVPAIIKMVGSTIADHVKGPTITCLINILESDDVQDQFVNSGGIQTFVKQLKSTNETVVRLVAMVLEKLTAKHTDLVVKHQAVPVLHKVIQTIKTTEVLVPVLKTLSNIAKGNPVNQKSIGTTPGFFDHLVQLARDNTDAPLLVGLTEAVDNIVRDERSNQNAFIGVDGTEILMEALVRHARSKDVLLNTVSAIHSLAENNLAAQDHLSDQGVQKQLMNMLKKSRADELQEKTGMALWALAGDDVDKQRKMAEGIGVTNLIEFLNSQRENLHYISSEGLSVLSQGPLSQYDEIRKANGIQPLIRLLNSDKDFDHIILSVVRTLRYLSVGIGNVPFQANQEAIDKYGGIAKLLQLMVYGKDEMIKVEAALTLGHVALGRDNILNKIHATNDFSYIRILKMMYAKEDMVRLLAGSALATFAYNNISQQKEISEQGGVRFNCFVPFLRSTDEFYRCNAAFQVVILSLIIPDEEQATSSAVGIKLLVELLQESKSDHILALAADCIARLAHTRAGVPAAIIAIKGVDYLFDLLDSASVLVEGCASIALSYLSYNHTGERRLLYRCRSDPYLKKVLNKYTKKNHRLSEAFIEGWKHSKRVGLPPIPDDRIKRVEINDDIPLADSPNDTSGVDSSTTHIDETPLTDRSARSSRTAYRSSTFHDSQSSLPTTSRTHSSISQQDMVAQES
ncbi:ankyrin and armadillo repeat-containing protein [Patella vulgata]|uniref:ankyrin and armadillo repeat-containing protein n=1 Tax=Patella vulgata TaxID=6465 RepID=UPI0024A8C03A|nr:ankyrin and armadillo repeat-containing protein [Patella vulgata]